MDEFPVNGESSISLKISRDKAKSAAGVALALRGIPGIIHVLNGHVEFRDSLPKTPIGKVLRRELRDPPTT